MKVKKAKVEPGYFLPTVARHIRFISGHSEDDGQEIRFVIEGGREFHPVSTYEHEGIVYVDLEPIEYEEGR